MTFLPIIRLRHNVLFLLQKRMQKLVIKNIKGETLGYVPYVYNNLPTEWGNPKNPEGTM